MQIDAEARSAILDGKGRATTGFRGNAFGNYYLFFPPTTPSPPPLAVVVGFLGQEVIYWGEHVT